MAEHTRALNEEEWEVFQYLIEKGVSTKVEISRNLGLDEGRMAKVLGRLEERGYRARWW